MAFIDLAWQLAEAGGIAAAIAGGFWVAYTRCSVQVPPNRALVLFGRKAPRSAPDPTVMPFDVTVRRPKIVVGGRVLVAPWDRGVGYLSLAPVVVDVTVRSMHALEGNRASGWEVRAQAQAKVPAMPNFLSMASENLLGKSEEEVRALVARTLEGAIPSVLARINTDSGEPDWDRLAAEVQASAAPDLVGVGLAIRTLTITELHRIVPPPMAPAPPRGEPDTEADESLDTLSAQLSALDARLARTERVLRILGGEIQQTSRRSSDEPDTSRSGAVFDQPLGSEESLVGAESPFAFLHGPTGGECSSPSRTSPWGDPAQERSSDSWPS